MASVIGLYIGSEKRRLYCFCLGVVRVTINIIFIFWPTNIFNFKKYKYCMVFKKKKKKKKINNNNNLQKIQFSSVDVNQKNHFWKRVYFIRWRVWRLVSGAQLQNNHDNIQTNPKLIHNQYFYDCFHIHIQFNTSLTPHTKLKFQNLRDNLEIIYKIFIPSCKLFMKFHLKN